jgi:hypothetical protein
MAKNELLDFVIACPCCRVEFDVLVALVSDLERNVMAEAFKFVQNGQLMLRYFYLFKPAHQRIKADKLREIMGELRDLMESGTISYKGFAAACPPIVWEEALKRLFAQIEQGNGPDLPLENHNYLKPILLDVSKHLARQTHNAVQQSHKRGGVFAPAQTAPEGNSPRREPTAEELDFARRQHEALLADLGIRGDDHE